MRRLRNAARKEELLRLQTGRCDPRSDCAPRLFGDLELHRPLGLLLHDNCAGGDMTAWTRRGHEVQPDRTRAACYQWRG